MLILICFYVMSGQAPAVVINFSWDAEVMADIAAANQGAMRVTYLKPDAMGQLQPL